MTATATFSKVDQFRRYADQLSGVASPALIAGEDVDAISMPAAFGALVQAELGIMMLAGPVIDDEEGSWTFLVERADTRRPTVPADLLPLGVRAVPAGTLLASADRPTSIWWTVIGAARRVAHRTSLAANA